MKKILITIVLVISAFVAGIWLSNNILTTDFFKPQYMVKEESQVLLEKVKTVCKLVTIEGEFSDIYSYKDHYFYDFSFFSKKALLKVHARVAVGFDLSKINLSANSGNKTIVLSNLPEPEILYIEPNVSYYDISEGTFNSFTPQELTKLNENARKNIRKKALKSKLFEQTKTQGMEMLDLIKIIVEQAGWQFVIQGKEETKDLYLD